MRTSEFDYELPEELVARHPSERRDESRLMRIAKESYEFSHHIFRELPDLLRPGDLMVFNNTRVLRARLIGRRAPDGGEVEALLLHREGTDRWRALVRPGKKIKKGDRIVFGRRRELEAFVEEYGPQGGGERVLCFSYRGNWWDVLEEVGYTPLPPYILRARKEDARKRGEADSVGYEEPGDRTRYQTFYAKQDDPASVAAPTAGLHFSEEVFTALEDRGVERAFLQLDVGAGTFRPIRTENVEDHQMHSEHFRLDADAVSQINRARQEGRRVVAVGTTVVRVLETAALVAAGEGRDIFEPDRNHQPNGVEVASATEGDDSIRGNADCLHPISGWTRLLISPGFNFRVTDALVTNFHLPRSSLLLLVSALAGVDTIRKAYQEAIELGYRFYSYGDCMLIE